MKIEPLEFWHLQKIKLQDEQAKEASHIKTKEYFDAVKTNGYAATLDDEVMGCFGVQEIWDGRGLMWCVLSKDVGEHMVNAHRAALKYVQSVDMRRVEVNIRDGFKEGERWVRMLGFKYEGHMKSFFYNGEDARLYARVR